MILNQAPNPADGFDMDLNYDLPGEIGIISRVPDWIYTVGVYVALAAVAYIAIAMVIRIFSNHNPPIGGKVLAVLGGIVVLANAPGIVNTFLV